MANDVYQKIPVERVKGFFKINRKEYSQNIVDFSEKCDILQQMDILANILSTKVSRLYLIVQLVSNFSSVTSLYLGGGGKSDDSSLLLY